MSIDTATMAPQTRPVQVLATEYVVCSYPDRDSDFWRRFSIRVIRFHDADAVGLSDTFGVFDHFGTQGARLDRNGQWSYPPGEDAVDGDVWRSERRFDEQTALELARRAAPAMTHCGRTIGQTLAWLEELHASRG